MKTGALFKKVKRAIFKRFLLAGVNKKQIKLPARKIDLYPMKSDFLLAVTVFNDAELPRLQFASLSKYLEDAFDYLVADDSSDERQAAETESFCREHKINYVRLPKNPGLDGSMCHGLALNWVYYNIVDKIKPRYFGLIDSDAFLISKGSILSYLGDENYWGIRNDREKSWYLWPGYCIFRYDFLKGKKVNFLPEGERDTGGGNYGILKNTATAHLAPASIVQNRPFGKGDTSQFFLNIIHLVGVTSMSSLGRGLDNKCKLLWDLFRED